MRSGTLVPSYAALDNQAFFANTPALPHVLDEQFVTLAVWGVLVPTIWGFNARWLPVFLGLPIPSTRTLWAAYDLSLVGVGATSVS